MKTSCEKANDDLSEFVWSVSNFTFITKEYMMNVLYRNVCDFGPFDNFTKPKLINLFDHNLCIFR